MKPVRFLAAADDEMPDAAARYEAQQENPAILTGSSRRGE